MNENYFLPENHLSQRFVTAMWQTRVMQHYSREKIIPSGKVEIIFNFSNSLIKAEIGSDVLQLPDCFINGYNTHPVNMYLPENLFFFGVRLHAHSVKQLLGFKAGEFANKVIDLTLIDKTIRTLWHQLGEAVNFKKRTEVMEQWLFRKTYSSIHKEIPLINFLNDNSNVHENPWSLSRSLSYSQRQLSRKFNDLTGMNSEEFLQYKRYLNATDLLHFSGNALTSIGYECNFYDQSHFIKVFRQYSGLTPGQYRELKSHLPGHIFQ